MQTSHSMQAEHAGGSTGAEVDLPTITVVVEGYNEFRQLGAATAAVEAISHQNYPLNKVNVVLVGETDQNSSWKESFVATMPYASFQIIDASGKGYFEIKNIGAQAAQSDIIAFTDSDVCPDPTWLRTIADNIGMGFDVSAGLSRFDQKSQSPIPRFLRFMASSITFGWVIGEATIPNGVRPLGWLAHNIAFRSDTFLERKYRTEFGRTLGTLLLYKDLKDAGAKMILRPSQSATHSFTWGWWLRLYYRIGYEVHAIRRVNNTSNAWIARVGILEPLLTLAWHWLFDLKCWFRYSKLRKIGLAWRIALLPVAAVFSLIARTSECIGMIRTMVAREDIKVWAETA